MIQDSNQHDEHALRSLEQQLASHPASPVFVRLAATLLEMQQPEQALKKCLLGLRRFPDHPTALLLMARSQVMLRQYNDARETLQTLLNSVPGSLAGQQLLERISALELEYPPVVPSSYQSFPIPEWEKQDSQRWSRQDDLLPNFLSSYHETTAQASAQKHTTCPGISDLAKLADRLEHARIPALPEFSDEEVIADERDIETVNLQLRPQTETLAKIYSAQGRYREAIDAFRSLVAQHPEKAEIFKKQIAELEQKLANS